MTVTIMTTTPLPERAVLARRTRVAVTRAAFGRVRVDLGVDGEAARPALWPMLLSSDDRGARVCLVPDGALLLAGDAVAVDIVVGPDARLEIVEAAGTVAYDMTGGEPAAWDVDVRVEAGAGLCWAGEPFVVSHGAHVRRRTTLHLADGAVAALRETLVLGRHGECPGRIEQLWRAESAGGVPLLTEELHLDAGSLRPGLLGRHRVVGSVALVGTRPPAELAPAGRMDLEGPGTVWRTLAPEAHLAGLEQAWSAASAAIHR